MQKVAVSASLRLQMTQADHTPKSDRNRDMINHSMSKEAGENFDSVVLGTIFFQS